MVGSTFRNAASTTAHSASAVSFKVAFESMRTYGAETWDARFDRSKSCLEGLVLSASLCTTLQMVDLSMLRVWLDGSNPILSISAPLRIKCSNAYIMEVRDAVRYWRP